MENEKDNQQPISSDEDNNERIIDGLRYPRKERDIDQLGFETTKHSLKFHGEDWDVPLTQQREELTRAFFSDATDATDEPEENISNLRFVVNKNYLSVRFTVRHKVQIHAKDVQEKLAQYKWSRMKKMYAPRATKPANEKPSHAEVAPKKNASIFNRRDSDTEIGQTHRQISTQLSAFGRTQDQ
ncbi:hypothetical protein AGDE_00070, partial [Angomonas deanei]